MNTFIVQAVQELDQSTEPQNFHLQFLMDFAARLGFAIPPLEESGIRSTDAETALTRKERQELLRALCDYFKEHVETWQEPKSLDVLMEVFD